MADSPTKITPYRNGPYLIRGPFVMVDQNGNEIEVKRRIVAITHDAGPAKGRLARLARLFPADAVVFGHSHLPLHEEEGGFQIFNPGGPTERRRAPRPSMGLLACRRNGLVFEHVWL